MHPLERRTLERRLHARDRMLQLEIEGLQDA
jgi:hypothetical protein